MVAIIASTLILLDIAAVVSIVIDKLDRWFK